MREEIVEKKDPEWWEDGIREPIQRKMGAYKNDLHNKPENIKEEYRAKRVSGSITRLAVHAVPYRRRKEYDKMGRKLMLGGVKY